jgi:hypothetical protein
MSRHVEDFDELYDMLLLARELESNVVIRRVLERAQLRIGRLESAVETLQKEKELLEIQLMRAGGRKNQAPNRQ